MTSFPFILGVLPLVRAAGADAEMLFALGVTIFGAFFTPVFHEVIRGRTDRRAATRNTAVPHAGGHAPAAPPADPT